MSIARNTFYNLVGTLVPLVLALLTVPAYLKVIGAERYGILAIAWLILGYFGLFDLGLGRATTQRIAALRDAGTDARATAFGTALAANVGIGFIGAAVLAPVAWYMFARGMTMSAWLRAETLPAVPLLALAVPMATTIGVLSGALMGRERFAQTNRISVVSTALFQVIPLAFAWAVSPTMIGLLTASIVARLLGMVMLARACVREFGADAFRRFDLQQLRALLAYGGWVTVTSMFGPFLVVADRFAIGWTLNSVAVTIYTVPMQITTRLSSLTGALGNALFPRLAIATGEEAQQISRDAVAILFAALTPFVVAAVFLMQPALIFWIGHDLGSRSAPVGRVLLAAGWLNSFAQVPYVRLQAQGRPDVVSKILLAELPFYLPALYLALTGYGLIGAAIVYLARVLLDLVLLTWFASRRLDHAPAIGGILLGMGCVEVFLRQVAPSPWATVGYAIIGGGLTLIPAWLILPEQARRMVYAKAGRLAGRDRAAVNQQ